MADAKAAMKLRISYPPNGTTKLIPIDSDTILSNFYDKRIAAEVSLDCLGEDWEGYKAKITGGNDKQGFPMMQGVLTADRVRLLLSKKHKCYYPRRKGERKRKSVRGCIVSSECAVISLAILAKGPKDIVGLTDKIIPKTRGPKRASKIRKLFNLDKEKDDVRNYVTMLVKKKKYKGGIKEYTRGVKIQRLTTPKYVHRKRRMLKKKLDRWARAKELQAIYKKLFNEIYQARKLSSPRRKRRRRGRKSKGVKSKKEKETEKVEEAS